MSEGMGEGLTAARHETVARHDGRAGRRPQRVRRMWLLLAAGGLLACGGVADESKLPPNVQDPATLKTPSGALARYRDALSYLGGVFDRAMVAGGVMTDELTALPTGQGVTAEYTTADSRVDLAHFDGVYGRLHRLRAQAREARGFLAAYAPDSSPALQGHLYAVEGYAEVLLADLFCSGIPLSTVDFEGNYTLAAGSTTADVYRHAAALFDSALALSADSARLQQFAAVAKGRALLALGEYAAAATAVSAVPDDFAYQVTFTHSDYFDPQQPPPDSAALWFSRWNYTAVPGSLSMADNEGGNGLDYRSSADPRTPALSLGPDVIGAEMYFPAQYAEVSPATFTLASGVEARLIEAEAALAAGSAEWLTRLNALRQTVGLADTTDPGAPAARVNLLFRERAFWLYLTGHRQGDLRRLIRNYPGRSSKQVYPTGTYPGGTGFYGNEVVIVTPQAERELNPKYTGCESRDP